MTTTPTDPRTTHRRPRPSAPPRADRTERRDAIARTDGTERRDAIARTDGTERRAVVERVSLGTAARRRAAARRETAARVGRLAGEQLAVAGGQLGAGVGNLVFALVAARL